MIQTTPLRGLALTASVIDPFGNILGLIQSPHHMETFANLLPSEGSE
ncbi:hypothetical protein [Nesterenkonia ebinurensis]|nr:hypothetical protein [Nesterenkonia ebinurensis]